MIRPPEIVNKAQLRVVLQDALARTDRNAAAAPSFSLPKVIRPQLELIDKCLKEGRVPTTEERKRMSLGPLSVREIEDADEEYASWLMALSYAFRHWEQLSTE
jgi:hypothetical protein